MFYLLSGDIERTHPGLADSIYRFRHSFFVDHLKWEACRKPDGRERDEFDGPDCLHVVGMEAEAIVSYSRLIPTTRPHLQTHLYPEILAGAPSPSGPRIYEWTRCAVAPSKRESVQGTDAVSGASFTAVAEAAEFLGLEGLLVQTHPVLVSRLMGMGWDVEPLALPYRYGNDTILPIYAKLTSMTVASCRSTFSLQGPSLMLPGTGKTPAPMHEPLHLVA